MAVGNGEWRDLISDYIQYTETTNTTELHRTWSAISMVGGALGRRIWTLAAGRIRTYANLYILLVGPPGSGKGIINDVKSIMRKVQEPTGGDAFRVSPDNMSRASLIDDLAKAKIVYIMKDGPPLIYHSMQIIREELQSLIPTFDASMVSTLNDLWNNDDIHTETRRHGPAKEVKIENPQVNILAGVQPSYLAELPEQTWNTGLIRRVIMIYASEKRRVPLFQKQDGAARRRQGIMTRLGQLSVMYGEAKWTPEAAEKINLWHMNGCSPEPEHSKLQNYNNTRTEFILKLALISALSRTADKIIEETDLNRAMEWLFEAERHMPDIFRAMLGKSDAAVMEELHFFVTTLFGQQKGKGVSSTSMYHFLLSRVPVDKAPKMLDMAERSNIVIRIGGTDLYKPVPKHQHGVE